MIHNNYLESGRYVFHTDLAESPGLPEDPTQLPNIFKIEAYDDVSVSVVRKEESALATRWARADFLKKFSYL